MSERYTLKELTLAAQHSPEAQLILRLTLTPDLSYDQFADLVEEALDLLADRLSQNPQLRQGRSEDELTIEFVDNFKSMGLDASHDTSHGGHADFVIQHRRKFFWLGEAKLHNSYDWLLQGYKQLTTSYANGVASNARGGMVIYSYRPRIDLMMETWRQRLIASIDGIRANNCPMRVAAFNSLEPHKNTGLDYRVRHLAVCLHHDPEA